LTPGLPPSSAATLVYTPATVFAAKKQITTDDSLLD
jgi:hypothetical protein